MFFERMRRREKEREREKKKMYTQVKYEFILERVKGEETRECGYKLVDLCERVCVCVCVCVCEGYREREKGGERERE
jgi:hypothetical protein